jgi:hypothetical protein
MLTQRGLRFALAGMLALAGLAGAQEVEKGEWINLFDGETTFGWIIFGDAEVEVEDGMLELEDGTGGWIATTSRFKDFELEAKLKIDGEGTAGLVVRGDLEGHPSEDGTGVITMRSESRDGEELDVKVTALGNNITATVNGEAVDVSTDKAIGHIGIQYHNYHGGRPPELEISSVRLRPLSLTPLFNGENLDGWNIIPDRESVFTVVDGAINIKDGNGQIETDGLYRDFIVQMDIISNGEHLNSGVFFRGPKGIFWKGYESQVRNQWVRDDRTRPVDFGTGGIYGVQPTRKVVPSDHEWFSKTILADGNHFAVWINGYQVSDLFDTRPPVDNGDGKAGYVPEAGTIHLQGHDPTTDLSFKNINIQEY